MRRATAVEKPLAVEKLWMTGANPVDNLTVRIFLVVDSARTALRRHVDAPFVITFA